MNYDQKYKKIIDIELALSSERDREKLLTNILDTAIEVANCDGGTLYLLENQRLHFRRIVTKSQNVRQGGPDNPIPLPPVEMEPTYVSAWAALNNRSLNIADIHNNSDFNFSGSYKYDSITGYKTISMLVVPLANDKGEIIGVLQLINALDEKGNVTEFSPDYEILVQVLAASAAIAITNMQYSSQIVELLYSLVDSLSTAIDARTPYNAMHTKNMSKYGAHFLDWLEETDNPWKFSKEKRSAFLLSISLHDVGKLVTPLEIMDKKTRLEERLFHIQSRIKETIMQAKIDRLEGTISPDKEEDIRRTYTEALCTVEKANVIGFLDDELLEKVRQLYRDKIITEEEFENLSIRKGTLTQKERRIMQDHVVMTSKILATVSFPKSYSDVPNWAGSHHELIDGSGYPCKLRGDEIPKEVRLLTIIDIFDALTAERPYKPAFSREKAFSILHNMAEKECSVDSEVLKLFEESLKTLN